MNERKSKYECLIDANIFHRHRPTSASMPPQAKPKFTLYMMSASACGVLTKTWSVQHNEPVNYKQLAFQCIWPEPLLHWTSAHSQPDRSSVVSWWVF